MSFTMTVQGIANNVQAILEASNIFATVVPAPPEMTAYGVDVNGNPLEKIVFNGYPSVAHYYNGHQNEYATVKDNRRIIPYVVDIVLVTPSTMNNINRHKAINKMADDITALFDSTYDLSSTALGLSKACDQLRPAGAELSRVMTSDGDGILLTFTLYCMADIQFRNL